MIIQLQKTFSILLVLLLALACLSASGAQATAPGQTQLVREAMPDGLMGAFLAASTRPFAASAEGYHARSGGLDFTLNADGLQAGSAGLSFDLALSGLGRGGEQVVAVAEAVIVQADPCLEYRRGALTEWYRNTAVGVEQGFTIHRAPRGVGPLVMQLDLSTDLEGMLDTDGRGLSFTASGGQTLHYDHLRAWDASGAQLAASLRYLPGQVMVQVNDLGATYPITVDPLVYVEQKVFASAEEYDQFGFAVALSGDGNTALVGAQAEDVAAKSDQGAAYVFVRSGTTWTQQAQLLASDGEAWDYFGWSVALSSDGNTALVGARVDDVTYNAQGSAYVFTRSGTIWSQQQKLTASDGAAGDQFGYAVALSGDSAMVGAPYDKVGANSWQGSAYVFTRSGATWTQQVKLTAADGAAYDSFGRAVALDGDTALVGADVDDVGANIDQGSATVFTRSGVTWSQQAQLTASDGAAEDRFGCAVALSGGTALIGACVDDVGANVDQGSATVFTRSGVTWSQQQKLTASDGAAYDQFGHAVALAGDTALVGVFYDEVGANYDQGSAIVFVRSGMTWSLQQKLTAADGAAGDYFGYTVALSGDGYTALGGAIYDDVGVNSSQGSATAFTRSGVSWMQQAQLNGSDGAAQDYFGYAVALSGDTAVIGVYQDDVGADVDQGSAYVFVRDGRFWKQQQQLIAADGAAGDQFGYAVALNGDTALVGAPYDDVGGQSDRGSVTVFVRTGALWEQQAVLTATLDGTAYDYFGRAVALSDDGDTALVGAYGDDVGANNAQGSAYVFTRSGTIWSQQQKLTAADGAAGDYFGYAVALSDDGDTALVGAVYDDVDVNSDAGSAYVFTRSAETWTQQARLVDFVGAASDYFGHAVALSSDGNTALVGEPGDDVGANVNQGSAIVLTGSGATWTPRKRLLASDGAEGDAFGVSVVLDGDMALVGAYYHDVGANADQGAAYVFTGSGAAWTQEARLTASDGVAGDYFGRAVAFDGDTALVGAYLGDVGANSNQGAAHFFRREFRTYLPLVLGGASQEKD
jgi:hypothetical protein